MGNSVSSLSNIISLLRNLANKNNNQKQSSRHIQENDDDVTCEESTCDERLSISIRIVPIQSQINSAEIFIKSCTLPNTFKQFRQNGKQMFVARTCTYNIF